MSTSAEKRAGIAELRAALAALIERRAQAEA
jgi:hypothetical protein